MLAKFTTWKNYTVIECRKMAEEHKTHQTLNSLTQAITTSERETSQVQLQLQDCQHENEKCAVKISQAEI